MGRMHQAVQQYLLVAYPVIDFCRNISFINVVMCVVGLTKVKVMHYKGLFLVLVAVSFSLCPQTSYSSPHAPEGGSQSDGGTPVIDLETERMLFEDQKAEFEAERKKFSEAAKRLGREVSHIFS